MLDVLQEHWNPHQSAFTPRFTFWHLLPQMPHNSVIAGFWIVSMNLWECCLCLCDLHSVISRLLGEPWFPHCAFVASWLTDCCCFALVSFVIDCVMLSSLLARFSCLWTDQLTTSRAGFWCVFWMFVVLWFVFCFCLFAFCVARQQLNGLCIDRAQFSFVCTLSSWLMLPLH